MKVIVFLFSEALFTLCESARRSTRALPLSASTDLFLTRFFAPSISHSSPLTLCSHLTPDSSLSRSLTSAGSEHFLLGENLTVAVLGVVIPIGKSSAVFPSVCPSVRGEGWRGCCPSCFPSTLNLSTSPSHPPTATFITCLTLSRCVGLHCRQYCLGGT